MRKRIIIGGVAIGIFFTTVSFRNDFFEIAKQLEIFTTLYKELNLNYVDELTPASLMDKAIKGMLEDLDPYTVYWNEQQVEDARINSSGIYTGVGVSAKTTKDRIIVLEPYQDYPADKAGLKAGDEIIEIDGVRLADMDGDFGDLLKGAPGTPVDVKYIRQNKTRTATITRSAVEVKAVPFYKLIGEDIGYIVLAQFNHRTTSETRAAMVDLKSQGATKLILDLRGNPGGLLNEAINVVNLFVKKGEVITTTQSSIEKYNQVFKTASEPVDTEIPVAVLINGRSASASEIVAGSLQDLDRGVVIGARSFGKGLVQRPKKLTYGTQLKVTISRYYTPSGRCIQALDYRHKDENGDPVRTDPKEFTAFKTRNGRTVYDGGGIQPDIELASAVFSPITTALLKDDAIFDFATQYYFSNEVKNLQDFKFTDADFRDFLAFLKKQNFQYETETEKKFMEAFRNAEDDELAAGIDGSYKQLLKAIDAAKEKAVSDKRIEVESLLVDEILKRYFYRQGLYEYHIRNNPEILEAVSVLNDRKRYSGILK